MPFRLYTVYAKHNGLQLVCCGSMHPNMTGFKLISYPQADIRQSNQLQRNDIFDWFIKAKDDRRYGWQTLKMTDAYYTTDWILSKSADSIWLLYEACKSTSPQFKFAKLIIKFIKRETNVREEWHWQDQNLSRYPACCCNNLQIFLPTYNANCEIEVWRNTLLHRYEPRWISHITLSLFQLQTKNADKCSQHFGGSESNCAGSICPSR